MTAKEIFEERLCRFVKLPPVEARLAAFMFVRDLAYGDVGSRDPFDVLERGEGTCSGKHALLKLFLEALGCAVETHFAKHDFSAFPIDPWPADLADFRNKELTDYHDFLMINIDGRWVSVDAIFDAPMLAWGFQVTAWDGRSDVSLPVKATQRLKAEGDPSAHKKKLIEALPTEVQKGRKAFLASLTDFLRKKRGNYVLTKNPKLVL